MKVLDGGSTLDPLSLGGSGPLIKHNTSLGPTSVRGKWRLNPSNGLSRQHKCDRRQTDRQTTLRRNVCRSRRQERFHLMTERERERERVYSPNKHKIRYNTIAKTQWQAAREAKYAYHAGSPYGNITSVTQYTYNTMITVRVRTPVTLCGCTRATGLLLLPEAANDGC